MVEVLLDTCVLSEFDRDYPNLKVIDAVDRLPAESLFVSVVSIGELTFGIELLPLSRKRETYARRRDAILQGYGDRVLGVDVETARIWGSVLAAGRRGGTVHSATDALIAATAIQHGLTVMTRNVRHFEPTGVTIVNPWADE